MSSSDVVGRIAASASTVASWRIAYAGTPLDRAASSRHAFICPASSGSGSGYPSGTLKDLTARREHEVSESVAR
jgi:hypothetical protein